MASASNSAPPGRVQTRRPRETTGLPKYTYNPLPTATSIRVLTDIRLTGLKHPEGEPTTGDDIPLTPMIQCSLKTIELNDKPAFDALSYTWGNPFRVYTSEERASQVRYEYSCVFPLLIDHQILWVGLNLHFFLFRLIHFSELTPQMFVQQSGLEKSDAIWIDAICVNQEDLEERSTQVSIMDCVYGSARIVLVWLGEEDPFMRPALNALLTFANLDDEAVASAKLINPILGNLQTYGISGENPCFAIYAFFNRAWFRRAWIVQEALLANRLVFMCGSIMGPWVVLFRSATFLFASSWWGAIAQGAANYIRSGVTSEFSIQLMQPAVARMMAAMASGLWEEDIDTFFDPIYVVCEIQSARAGLGRGDKFLHIREDAVVNALTWMDILTRFRTFETTDPKDKIFAFLGLRPQDKEHPSQIPQILMPDYRHKTVEQIYTDATWYLLQITGNLNVLCEVQDISLRKLSNLPSWVPDFSGIVPGITIGNSTFSPFTAAGDTPLSLKDKDSTTSPQILELEGILIDTIQAQAKYDNAFSLPVLNLINGLRPFYTTDDLPQGYKFVLLDSNPTPESSSSNNNNNIVIPIKPSTPRPRIQTRIEALWRTLLADCCDKTHPAPLKYGFAFHYDILQQASQDLTCWMSEIFLKPHKVQADPSGWENEGKEDVLEEDVSEGKEEVEELDYQEPYIDESEGQQSIQNRLADEIGKFHIPQEAAEPEPHLEVEREESDTQRQSLIDDLLIMNPPPKPQTHLEKVNQRKFAISLLAVSEPGDFAPLSTLEAVASSYNRNLASATTSSLPHQLADINVGPTRFLPNITELSDTDVKDLESVPEYWLRTGQISKGRSLFRTKNNKLLGIGPSSAQMGDEVWVLKGGKVPFLLRKVGDDGSYRLVGEAYVHGIMHGEGLVDKKGQNREFQKIVLE